MNLLKRPVPYNLGSTSMVVWWETDSDSVTGHGLNVQLSGGSPTFYAATTRIFKKQDGTNATSHFVELTGLLQNSITTVQVVGPNYISTPTWSFEHVPLDEELNFAVINDVEGNFSDGIVDDLEYLMLFKHSDANAILSCGDLLTPGEQPDYYEWSRIYANLSTFLESSKGTVFASTDVSKTLMGQHLFPNSPTRAPYFANTIANIRVVALDTSPSGRKSLAAGGNQLRWFLNEIKSREWKNADYRIILGSTPPTTSLWGDDGRYADGTDRFLNQSVGSMLKNSGATLAIFGSGHSYQRGVYPSDYPAFEDLPVQYVICSGFNSPHTNRVGDWTAESEPSFIVSSSENHYVRLTVNSSALTLVARDWSSDALIDQISFSPRNLD